MKELRKRGLTTTSRDEGKQASSVQEERASLYLSLTQTVRQGLQLSSCLFVTTAATDPEFTDDRDRPSSTSTSTQQPQKKQREESKDQLPAAPRNASQLDKSRALGSEGFEVNAHMACELWFGKLMPLPVC